MRVSLLDASSLDASSVAVAIRPGDPAKRLVLRCGGLSDSLTSAVLERIGVDLAAAADMPGPVVPAAGTTALDA